MAYKVWYFEALAKMEYKGYRLNNLYRDAENDIIDDLKDEVKYLKQKIKECKYREEGFEKEMDAVTCENKITINELDKTKMKLRESRNILEQMEKEENTEIEELEIKIKTTLAKKDKIVEESQKAKSIGEKVILKLKDDNKVLECEIIKLKEEKLASEKECEEKLNQASFDFNIIEKENNSVNDKQKEYIMNLETEVEKLQAVNQEKENLRLELTEEIKDLKEIEMEKDKFSNKTKSETTDELTLFEELEQNFENISMFECDVCDQTFSTKLA